ncbi:MAG TPA: protein kinase [Candidatus Eisenbacteria bacterium]
MPLTAGTRLGPYEVVSPLGSGGMGEVYRARDTRLLRDVAVKVLPEQLSANPDLRARFEREARAISSLNHPHICTLHDVGREGGIDYLVMEMVEGETLAARLERGPLPLPEVLRTGAQIADALDRAHRAGVVHRDLKPGNVMLTKSGAKLMDFGLARATGLAGPMGEGGRNTALTQSPTLVQPLTAEGSIIGTFQYMSPEQLEGKEADARSDLWALGCVLYEMATGRRAFDGRSQASLISSIMKEEPAPIGTTNPVHTGTAGFGLERLVSRCLAKSQDDRWQNAGDLKHELEWLASGQSSLGASVVAEAARAPATRRRRSETLAWVLAAAGIGTALVLYTRMERSSPGAGVMARVSLPLTQHLQLSSESCDIAISPDGRTVAFVAADSTDVDRLWLRSLDSPTARMIPESESATSPFWSPDSRQVAFFGEGSRKLKKVSAAGGSPVVLADASTPRGGSWSSKGVIVFAPAPEGHLLRLPAEGGEAKPATVLDSSRKDTAHRFPSFLPDGDHFLYAALPPGPDGYAIFAGSLSSTKVTKVMVADSAPAYVEPGFLLFSRDGKILAQRFDRGKLAVEGDAVPIAAAGNTGGMDTEPVASGATNGALVYLQAATANIQFQWFDRRGTVTGSLPIAEGAWAFWDLSLDDRRVVIEKDGDLWAVDVERPVPTRLTSTGNNRAPVWTPDGNRVAFYSNRAGSQEIYTVDAGGGDVVLVPTTTDKFKTPLDWSRDGRYLVFGSLGASTDWDIWLLPLFGDKTPVPFLRSPFFDLNARVSPDGRWIAYESSESGQTEVYVQSFPTPGRKARVSTTGGRDPAWSRGGRELIYRSGSNLVSVDFDENGGLGSAAPQVLFAMPFGTLGGRASADGNRFLIGVPARDGQRPEICLIQNWTGLVGQ